jgi:hypothetical protein
MKPTKFILIVAGAVVSLTLLPADKDPNTPTKAQQILRQKMSELDGNAATTTPVLPTKEELLNDVQRLHREGKISDQQLETFKKNLTQHYLAPGAPSTDAQLRTQQLVEQKLAEARAQQAAPTPAASQAAQAKAQQALVQKSVQEPKPPPQPAPTRTAEKALDQKSAGSGTPPKAGTTPPAGTGALTPELEAKAREVLRSQVAASSTPQKVEPASSSDAQAKALAVLREQQAAALSTPAPQATPQPAPATRPAAKPASPKPKPAPAAQTTKQPTAKTPSLAAQPKTKSEPKTRPEPKATAKTVAAVPAPTPAVPVAAPPVEPTPNPEAQARALAALRQYELQERTGVQTDTSELTKTLRLKVAELEGGVPPDQTTPTRIPAAEPVPLPSSDKAGLERLAELTALYKADRITPEQYHLERAKIVSTLR